ncbi:MAG: glycosyltransferase family protein [Gammaproteobacteria bacterium]|nr:glycosyltransferase family protein [Gammaproteobacteria bacterium]
MNKVVIVQARYGSTRLPGKVLKKLGSQTVLHHVLNRCLAIDGIDRVCCAIPDSDENEIIVEEAAYCDVNVSRGSETDVLNRYYLAAVENNADTIIRVTSDCPLIDPGIVSAVLNMYEQEGADFASNNEPKTWPHGLDCEVFSMGWLERANKQAVKQFDREHVAPYIRNHLEVKKINLPAPVTGLENYRWTLDTMKDFLFMEALFEAHPEVESNWSYELLVDIMRTDSHISALERQTREN